MMEESRVCITLYRINHRCPGVGLQTPYDLRDCLRRHRLPCRKHRPLPTYCEGEVVVPHLRTQLIFIDLGHSRKGFQFILLAPLHPHLQPDCIAMGRTQLVVKNQITEVGGQDHCK